MEKRKLRKKEIIKTSFIMIYKSTIHLLLFEIIYKGLISILFKPLINIIVFIFIRAKGYEILINEEISKFLLSFTGVFMLLVLVTISIILVYYEFSVILLILDKSKKGEKINLLEISENALVKLKNIINYRNLGLALYILVLIPILNIGIQSSLIPTLSIPDFITGEVAKYPGSGLLFAALTFALLYLFAKLFISLPIMLFSGKSFKEASRLSFKTIKGEGLQVALLIAFGIMLWIILTYLPFMLFKNVELILLRILRIFFNISMTIFTLLISPFILAISFEIYNSYVEFGDLSREKVGEKIELSYIGQKLWSLSEKILEFIQNLFIRIKNPIKLFIGLTLLVIIALNIYSEKGINIIYKEQLLIGHRGGDYGVENTMESIIYAGLNGADYVEIDVLLSKDNVPVVIHDNNLKRLAGISKNISDLTAEEIRKITIKSGNKESKIPTLEELAKEVEGRIKLLVEFKIHGQEKVSIIDKTIEVLEREGVLEETIFHTSSIKIIEEFNEKHDNLPLGYVFIGKIGGLSSKKMSRLPVDFISAEESLINKKMIRAIHKSDKAIFAWTINDEYKAERLLELGVDGLITDYPVEMIQIRDKYKEDNQ